METINLISTMNVNINLHKIKHFKTMFDPRTYSNFLVVVKGVIALRDWKQADLALLGNKTLRQIQYFFNGAKWSYTKLNEYRLRFLRNKPNYADRKSDFAVLDGSAIGKDKDSHFSGLTEMVYSNTAKQTVNGFYLFGASVITNHGTKYIIDFTLFFAKQWLSATEAWKAFAQRIVEKTSAWIIIVDSGLKGKYFCSYIYKNLKRHFLIRLDTNHTLLIDNKEYLLKSGKKKRGRKKKYYKQERTIAKLLQEKSAIQLNNGKLWVFKDVLIKTWLNEFTEPVQIIVFLRKGCKTPMVLAISLKIEHMKDVEHYHFVEMYYKRWSIETLFKEVKSWFCFEKFKVLSMESIMKYLHIVIFCHTLLSFFLDTIHQNESIKLMVISVLKKTRNIKDQLTIIGLKLFCESLLIKSSSIPIPSLLLNKNYHSNLLLL